MYKHFAVPTHPLFFLRNKSMAPKGIYLILCVIFSNFQVTHNGWCCALHFKIFLYRYPSPKLLQCKKCGNVIVGILVSKAAILEIFLYHWLKLILKRNELFQDGKLVSQYPSKKFGESKSIGTFLEKGTLRRSGIETRPLLALITLQFPELLIFLW